VLPELLRDLRARHWIRADHGGELPIRRHWFHERRVRCALRTALLRSLLRWCFLRGFLGAALLRAALLGGFLTTLLCSHSLSRYVEWLGTIPQKLRRLPHTP